MDLAKLSRKDTRAPGLWNQHMTKLQLDTHDTAISSNEQTKKRVSAVFNASRFHLHIPELPGLMDFLIHLMKKTNFVAAREATQTAILHSRKLGPSPIPLSSVDQGYCWQLKCAFLLLILDMDNVTIHQSPCFRDFFPGGW